MSCKKLFYICLGMLCSLISMAEESILTPVMPEPVQGYWMFSGLVHNESQEPLGYFFQMERQDKQFHVRMAVMDERSGKLLLQYEEAEAVDRAVDFNWKVGHAFLRFNAINESWVFGVKMPDKTGFNFKVDMLANTPGKRKSYTVSKGMEALIYQTGRLDGLLQTEPQSQEQFVKANNAWFSKIWRDSEETDIPPLHIGFCRFTDGAGFYSGALQQKEAKHTSFASFLDMEGLPMKMSQFIHIDSGDNQTWKINLKIPKMDLAVQNRLHEAEKKKALAAGFFMEASKGFCVFSEQRFG